MQWPNWLIAQANASSSIASTSIVVSGNTKSPRSESLGSAGAQLPDDVVTLALSYLSLTDLCRGCIPAGRALAQAVVCASATLPSSSSPASLHLFSGNHHAPSTDGDDKTNQVFRDESRNGLQWSSALLADSPPSGGYRSILNHWLQGLFTSTPRPQADATSTDPEAVPPRSSSLGLQCRLLVRAALASSVEEELNSQNPLAVRDAEGASRKPEPAVAITEGSPFHSGLGRGIAFKHRMLVGGGGGLRGPPDVALVAAAPPWHGDLETAVNEIAKWLPKRVRCLSCAGTRVRLPFQAPPHLQGGGTVAANDTNGLPTNHNEGGSAGADGDGRSATYSSANTSSGSLHEDLRKGGWNEQGLVLVLLRLPRDGTTGAAGAVAVGAGGVARGAASLTTPTSGLLPGADGSGSASAFDTGSEAATPSIPLCPPLPSSPSRLSLSQPSSDGLPGRVHTGTTTRPPLTTPQSSMPTSTSLEAIAPSQENASPSHAFSSLSFSSSSSSSSSALVSAVASTAHACCAGRGPSQVRSYFFSGI